MNKLRIPGIRLMCCVLMALLLVGLTDQTTLAQSIDWEKSHGSSVSGYAVARLDDGGFIAVGAGGQWPNTQGYVIRTNAEGEKVWDKAIGTGNPGIWLNGVKKTADGQLAIVGTRNSMPWLWKYDLDGNEKWDRQLMGPFSYGDARAVVTVPDGIVVTGSNSVAGKYNVFVHKFSLAGDSLWSMQLNKKGSDGYGIRQGLDGDFLIAGRLETTDGYESYLVKVSAAGALIWDKSYPKVAGTFGDAANDVSIAPDGLLLVGSRAIDNNNTQMEAIKVTLDGTFSWRKQYGTPGYGGINSVRPLTDGFIVAGYTGTSQVTKGRIMRLDLTGGVTANKELEASYLHYVDQAIPPAKYVVVGGTLDFTKLYLARVDMTSTPVPQDEKTFVYYYDNVPKWAITAGSGWQGDGPGRIKLVAAKDTVRINGMIRFEATHFRIDTTRTSATGTMSFQASGRLLASGSQPAGKEVLASGNIVGRLEQVGLRLTDPLWSENGKGPGGTTMKIDLIQPGAYPASTEYEVGGTLRTPGVRKCGQVSTDLQFVGLKITAQSPAFISYLEAFSTEPGVCIYNVEADYDQSNDQILLEGDFVSGIYFPSGVRAKGSIKNGELSDLTLTPKSAEVPLGRSSNAFIKDLTGTYKAWYLTFGGVKIPIGYAAFISGVIRDKHSKFEIDVANGAITAPGKLYTEPTSYRMYKAGDNWHIHGNSEVNLEWSEGYMNFSTVAGNFAAVQKKSTQEVYFLGQGNGKAHVFTDKPATYSGLAREGHVQLPPEIGIFLAAYGYLNEVTTKMLADQVVPAWAWIQQDTALLMPIYPGYALGPLAIQLDKTSDDPGFLRAPTMREVTDIYLLQLLGIHRPATKPKDNHTVAAENEFTVMSNSPALYVRVIAKDGVADPTSLVTPSGAIITAPKADSSVQLLSIDNSIYWWVVTEPEAGTWKITAENPGDSAMAYVFKPLPEFMIDAQQNGQDVKVTWTNPSEGDMHIYLDTDGDGYDGISVMNLSAAPGIAQFTIPSGLTGCEYRVYAMRKWGTQLLTDYADATITNELSLSAPSGLAATYDASDKTADLTWSPSSNAAVAGYAIRLSGNGLDSIIATQFVDLGTLTFALQDPDGYFVSIMSYDTNGNRSCWSARVPLGAADVKHEFVQAKKLDAIVLPNPARGRASLYLRMDEGSNVRITVYDAAGRVMNSNSQYVPMGEHDMDLGASTLPNGSYVVIIETGGRTETRNFVIAR